MKPWTKRSLIASCAVLLYGCGEPAPEAWSGWLEGETVAVATTATGTLSEIRVRRGDTVSAGQPLYSVEAAAEQAAVREAEARLDRTRAQLADLGKGGRPTELEALAAQLEQGRVAEAQAEREWRRRVELAGRNFVSREQADAARAAFEAERSRVRELRARLQTAGLSARRDAIEAARADVAAAEAQLAQARWRLDQKTVKARVAGRVEEVLYRPGEWLDAGRPVVVLLPPENLKARFFVPQAELGRLPRGQRLLLRCDGCAEAVEVRLDFVAAQPEYTPPQIYSERNRASMVFRAEAHLDPRQAARLHAGQPIEIDRPRS